eukprot:9453784-Pyramimonas_sp.AAC.1
MGCFFFLRCSRSRLLGRLPIQDGPDRLKRPKRRPQERTRGGPGSPPPPHKMAPKMPNMPQKGSQDP